MPGTVQAVNYDTGGPGVAYNVTSVNGTANSYRPDGVDLEATSDTGGGDDLGWTATGQWFKYSVNVATAGTYTVTFRVASPNGVTDGLHIANSAGTNLSGNVNVPDTGGWQTWGTVTAAVTLPAGQQTLTVDQDNGGWNLHTMAFAAAGSGEAPYGGTPAAVPGTVQAANYDTGGQGVAYNVTSTNGTANSYRSDGVDLEATADTQDTSPAGGADDLGWTATGQWFKYTVNVATAGTYSVSVRLAAPAAVTDGLHIASSSGTNLTGAIAVPATGGYQDWTTVTTSVTLPAGQQALTIDQDNGGWNIHYLAFAAAGSGPASALTASPASLSFGSETVGSTTSAQTVTVSNPNAAAVPVSQLAVSGPFSQTNTCGASIAANGSCTVSIAFAPTATGSASGSLTVASSAPGSPLTVALSGTGTASSTTNLALNQPATASSVFQNYVPSNVTDGNTSTYWESTDGAAYPQTITVNLGRCRPSGPSP